MDIILIPLLQLVITVISMFVWAVLINVILSWLVAFGVVNTSNQFVSMVLNMLYRITEPALAPIRRVLPDLGGLDLSPVVLILLLYFVQGVLSRFMLTL